MEVQIPSPSVFLRKSPVLSAAPTLQAKRPAPVAKPKGNAVAKGPSNPVQDGAVTKPKQSKSRNGCMTCKKKRLKCDETKPSCVQCQKRSVVCEGYKKDYKWRTFEETTFTAKPAATKKKTFRSNSFALNHNVARPLDIAAGGRPDPRNAGVGDPMPPRTWSPGLHSAFETAAHAFHAKEQSISISPEHHDLNAKTGRSPPPLLTPDSIFMPPFDPDDLSPTMSFGDSMDPYSLTTTTTNNSSGNDNNSNASLSDGSPPPMDFLLPGDNTAQPPEADQHVPLSPFQYQQPTSDSNVDMQEEDFDEEIIRSDAIATTAATPSTHNAAFEAFRTTSPTPSESSISSKSSNMTILAQPSLDASSPEMLMLRFDKQTCGILSVKDGPTENPWRTLIWPLARESPALYHAISSMTAFHGAHEIPNLHVPGMAHMTKSIKRLAFEIENMRLDSALATSLALAFSEGWDSHVSTGVQHLRGAKVMVNNAVVKHQRDMQLGQMTTQDANRLKFLCNTFVYMDVIARLTSLEEAQDLNFEEILRTVNAPFGDQVEVDPLMGCATTLFPLIGRAANLIQHVRKTETNSLTIVSTAMELKEQLQQWKVPSVMVFERPEDPNSEVQHSIQTAEAYRYATLLYLHQAVPEIPSDPAQTLAKKVLLTLAAVPLSSRATIIHIFPLFAASCEVTAPDDRSWVMQRWAAMLTRLKLGNVRSCWNVVQEVWNRRDAYENEKANRLLRRYTSRGIVGGSFVPPGMSMPPGFKRKGQTVDTIGEEDGGGFNQRQDPQAGIPEDLDPTGRPMKRRATLDAMHPDMQGMTAAGVLSGASTSMPLPVPLIRRHTSDLTATDESESEYTVRGRLHWLGVMADWQWEVFLG